MIFVFLFRFLLSGIFATLYQYRYLEKVVGIVTGLGEHTAQFLMLLNFVMPPKYYQLQVSSINIDVQPAFIMFLYGPYYLYKVLLVRKTFIM